MSEIFWISLCVIGLLSLINVGYTVCNLLIWRGCMKMYTEYFKDRSAGNRKEKVQ